MNTYGKYKYWIDARGYPIIWVGGKEVLLHVYVWEQENGSKPLGHDVHHIDHNKANFELSNLMLVTQSQHQRLHAGWIMEDGVWVKKPCNKCSKTLPLSEFYYISTRKIESNYCKPCHNKTILERNKIPEIAIKKKAYWKEYHKKRNARKKK